MARFGDLRVLQKREISEFAEQLSLVQERSWTVELFNDLDLPQRVLNHVMLSQIIYRYFIGHITLLCLISICVKFRLAEICHTLSQITLSYLGLPKLSHVSSTYINLSYPVAPLEMK
jgi:hypothetical protein